MSHINLFQTNAEFTSAYTNDYIEPWVSYTMETSGIAYNKGEEPHDYSQDYLTFAMLEDDTTVSTSYDDIFFSIDNGETWSNEEITGLNTGDKVLVKANRPVFAGSIKQAFNVDKTFNVEGNIMSLIYGDDFKNKTTLPPYDPEEHYSGEFCGAFWDCGIISAENLILPATTLTTSCYQEMFLVCSQMTIPPTLPATTLAENCYNSMFYGCTSLTTAPALPATTLTENCYGQMFRGCASLTTAPELPATTLESSCYQYMFWNCTSLTTAPELPATTLEKSCYNRMFYGCRSLTAAPELPATTLANYCYSGMFNGCTSLNYIKCLATDISANSCTSGWVNGVASNGTFVKDASMTDWTAGSDGIPNGWTVQDA